MTWIIHFELIETTIQMLHIAFTSTYWNTNNNLMLHKFIFEWVNEFFHMIFWTINIRTWVESFTLSVAKSTIHVFHFAFTTIFWNGCIIIWKVSHSYLNGLVIRSKCLCMQTLGCMYTFKLYFSNILNSCTFM